MKASRRKCPHCGLITLVIKSGAGQVVADITRLTAQELATGQQMVTPGGRIVTGPSSSKLDEGYTMHKFTCQKGGK